MRYVRGFAYLFCILGLGACSKAIPTVETALSYTGITASLTNKPVNTNNTTNLNITVGGSTVIQYEYKVGDSTTDCTNYTGYNGPYLINQPIADDISALSDGNIVLCVLGSDGITTQPVEHATKATWTKDTVSPLLVIDLLA